jgi:Aspartyl protease
MPWISGRHDNSQVFIDVGVVDALAMVNQPPAGADFPVPPRFRALVDTGAQRTMITSDVDKTVGLQPIGKIALQGIGGAITYHNGYLFHVAFMLPRGAPQPLPSGQTQQQFMIFIQQNVIHGGELSSAVGFDVLLGMDIISTGALHIEGNGAFSFSF